MSRLNMKNLDDQKLACNTVSIFFSFFVVQVEVEVRAVQLEVMSHQGRA